MGNAGEVAEQVAQRLAAGPWDTQPLEEQPRPGAAAAELATFALRLSGKRRQAKRGGRLGRLIARFALAACVALASVAAACEKPDASPEATATALQELPSASGSEVAIGTASPRGSPARFTDLVLVDAGTDAAPWATLVARGGNAPILVDRVGAGMDASGVGHVYSLAAQPVPVGTRDGPSVFLDPLTPADDSDADPGTAQANTGLKDRWSQDERYLAPTRAITGQPSVLDAAYNAAAAASAGGTHTYLNGVVLRVEPDQPVLEVIDRGLLESGKPTRTEDVVYVAIRASERSLYEPGQVVNLRDVVVDRQQTDVNGQPTTVYVANAALQGARVEPTGSVDLQGLLQPRLQRVDQDLVAQTSEVPGTPAPQATAGTPQPTVAPAPGAAVQQPVIVQNQYRGPSFVDDFLIWMWLSNRGYYRGSTVIINNPPSAPYRSGDVYYSAPPTPSSSTPSTVASAQADSRSTALQASRTSVSGQAAGTGGGVAATNKSAADTSANVSAATAKSAAAAGSVSSSSAGKSVPSAPSSSSSTASRSAGSTSAGTRGSASTSSSSSGGKGVGSSSSSGGGFGGKGVSGGGSSSS